MERIPYSPSASFLQGIKFSFFSFHLAHHPLGPIFAPCFLPFFVSPFQGSLAAIRDPFGCPFFPFPRILSPHWFLLRFLADHSHLPFFVRIGNFFRMEFFQGGNLVELRFFFICFCLSPFYPYGLNLVFFHSGRRTALASPLSRTWPLKLSFCGSVHNTFFTKIRPMAQWFYRDYLTIFSPFLRLSAFKNLLDGSRWNFL